MITTKHLDKRMELIEKIDKERGYKPIENISYDNPSYRII